MYQGSTSTYISSPHSRNLPKKRRKSVFFPHAKKFFQTYKSALLVLTIIILIGIIVHFIYSFTIGKETNIIRTATFTDEAIEQYHNINLYTYIRNLLSGKNIIMTKLYKLGSIEDKIKNVYPFVYDISLTKTSPSTVSVDIKFRKTELLFQNSGSNLQIAYTNETLFPITPLDTISSGALVVQVPDYFGSENRQENATGYLSLMGPERLKIELKTIEKNIPLDNIIFLPGAQKSIIISGTKRIIFDHKRSIQAQLDYLHTMETHGISGYYDIDLTTFPKIIVKKLSGPF